MGEQRHVELITVENFWAWINNATSEAANERCFDNRDALRIAFLILYARKVLFKIFEKYLWMSLFLVKVAGLGRKFY